MAQPETGQAVDHRSLADLLRWMNGRPRPPGAEKKVWRHRTARRQLELLGLRFLQKARRCKLYFRVMDLERAAPLLAKAFLGPEMEARARAE